MSGRKRQIYATTTGGYFEDVVELLNTESVRVQLRKLACYPIEKGRKASIILKPK